MFWWTSPPQISTNLTHQPINKSPWDFTFFITSQRAPPGHPSRWDHESHLRDLPGLLMEVGRKQPPTRWGGETTGETFFQVKIIRSLWPLKGVFGAGNMYTSVWYLQTSPNHLNELTLLSCIPQNIQTFLYIDPRCPTDMSKRCGNTILCGMKFSHLFFLTNLPNSFYFLPVKNARINLPIQFSVFLGEIKSDSKSEGVRLILQQSQASNKTLTLIKENLDCISLMRQCSWTLKVTSWSRCPCQKSKSVWYKNAFNTVSKIQTWHQEETLFIPILIAILGSYDFQEAYSRRIFIAIIGITSEMRLQVTSGPKSPWVSTLDNERHLDQWNNGEVAWKLLRYKHTNTSYISYDYNIIICNMMYDHPWYDVHFL